MKTLNNGLQVLYFDDLQHGVDTNSIKKKAKAICDARRKNAVPLLKAKNETLLGLSTLEPALQEIKDNIGSFCSDSKVTDKIVHECDTIIKSIPIFRRSAEILCSRLNDGKIKIVSIGQKSQGKSLFTQLYTHIPQNSPLLKVKDDGDTRDCTGAVNTYFHKEEQTIPLIEVEFLSVSDVIKTILSYIRDIQKCPGYEGWTINGITESTTQQELRNIVTDSNNLAKINNLSNIPSDLKKGLKQYFSHGDGYVSKLGNQCESISEDEVAFYNDMQNPVAYYLAVQNISVTLNLGMNGLFEYFEIADTMGASIEAGTYATTKIYNVIDESDAVFSIARANQNQNWNFYNRALGDIYRGKKIFKEKHFAILNIDKNFDKSAADTGIDVLDDQNLSRFCYVGRLKEDKEIDNCNPVSFVQDLIVHMLGEIANNIIKFDNDRICICRQNGELIEKSLVSLRQLLRDVKYKQFDEKQLVKDKVRAFCDEARKYIDDQMSNMAQVDSDEDNDDDDYDIYYKAVTKNDPEKRYASLYEVLTGEVYPNRMPVAFDEDEDKDVELSDAVSALLDEVYKNKKNIIKENMDNVVHFGEYVDSVSGAISDAIWPRLFERRIQHPITYKERDILFDRLWKIFRLDIIFNENNWNPECVDKTDNLKILNKIYKEGISEVFQTGKYLFTSYTILQRYFRLIENEEVKKIDIKLFHQAFEKEIGLLQIRKQIIDRVKNYPNAIRNFFHESKTAINNIDTIVHSSGDDFYDSNLEQIVSGDDRIKLQNAKKWDQVKLSIAKVKNYQFNNIPLIQVETKHV